MRNLSLTTDQAMTSFYSHISPLATGKQRSSRCSQEPAHRRLKVGGRSSTWIEVGIEFGSRLLITSVV